MNKNKKLDICIIVSNVSYALPHNWFVQYINSSKFNVSYILLNKDATPLEDFLISKNIKTTRVKYTGKKDLFFSFFKVFYTLLLNRPKIIHCHLFDASIIGLLAGKILFIKKRIYTRHHSDYHHTYYPKAVRYDLFNNLLSTKIVAISNNVANILIHYEHVSPKKISIIEHGFDLNEFYYVAPKRVIELKKKYNILEASRPIIGVISRYMDLKGIQYIIPAFKETLKKHPNALLVLSNTNGTYKNEIQKLLITIPEENYIEIVFERDIAALYRLFSVFIHVPIDKKTEAFGQTYIEALASEIPCIFTLSGIAADFVVNDYNALVVDYKNSAEISISIEKILTDKILTQKLMQNGKKSILKFDYTSYIKKLEDLYLE